MVDENKTKTQASHRSNVQAGTPIGVNLIASSKEEMTSVQKKSTPKNKAHYGEYVIWLLIFLALAVLPYWKVTREFLDHHSGAVSAIGTIAIMLLTMAYVRYSRHQWQVMDRQLEQMRQQLPELRKAADAAEESAQAAKTSADALVASEQAWITVNLEFTQLLGNVDENTQTRVYVTCVCKNYGKTPAWIDGIDCKLDIPKWFDEHPDFSGLEPCSSKPEMIGPGDESKPRQLSPECDGRKTPDNVVALYGIVKYRDMFGANRTSTFGYSVIDIQGTSPRLERLSYRAYNENT